MAEDKLYKVTRQAEYWDGKGKQQECLFYYHSAERGFIWAANVEEFTPPPPPESLEKLEDEIKKWLENTWPEKQGQHNSSGAIACQVACNRFFCEFLKPKIVSMIAEKDEKIESEKSLSETLQIVINRISEKNDECHTKIKELQTQLEAAQSKIKELEAK